MKLLFPSDFTSFASQTRMLMRHSNDAMARTATILATAAARKSFSLFLIIMGDD